MSDIHHKLFSDDKSKVAELYIPGPDNLPSVIALAYHKAGSVLLDAILSDLCKASGRPYVRLDTLLFNSGFHIKDFSDAVAGLISPIGYVYGVFRTYIPAFESEAANGCHKVCLIRDPRDVIVSYFYSLRYSHAIPTEGEVKEGLLKQRSILAQMSIDESVEKRQFDFLFQNMMLMARFLDRSDTVMYRYEDIIFAKREWVRSLATNARLELSQAQIETIADRHDVRPDKERPQKHVRQVKPGNYKSKLSPKSIELIAQQQGRLLATLNYD